MTPLERSKDVASLSRTAALLSKCFKFGEVTERVATGLNSVFPEAILLSVSVPSKGLSEVLLISTANFLEKGFTSIGLSSLKTSAAGKSFDSNTLISCAAQYHDQDTIRYHDVEHARDKWHVHGLVCCPIPLSLPAALARQSCSEAETIGNDVLGVITLGLPAGAATNTRLKEVLQELATSLAETIEHDSAALVEQVCQYHLGVSRTEPPDEVPMQEPSASCSDESRNDSGSRGAGPPSGGLPQLVAPEGGPGGHGPSGSDGGDRANRHDKSGGAPHSSEEQPRSGKAPPADDDDITTNAADIAVPARPSAPVPPLGAVVPGTLRKSGGSGQGSEGDSDIYSHAGSSGKSALQGFDSPKWNQKLRARMVDTFDARKAGCSVSAFEAAAYDPQEKGAAKKAFAAARVRNFARTPAMTFVDEGLEAEYVHWQARQRWQLDAAGLLFLLLITGTSIAMSPAQPAEAVQRLWLACLLHVLPLAAMTLKLTWYLRKRELVLGAYMVCLAFHAVYLRNRVALQLGPQSSLATLVWFSRVHAAEPLLFHAVMFAVRFRTALLVQAVCVVIAASNAAAVCGSCCSSFMGPTFCLLKALATQVVFGYGVPAAVLYFTEENFRQIFAEARLSDA